jgi:hypothetical protein
MLRPTTEFTSNGDLAEMLRPPALAECNAAEAGGWTSKPRFARATPRSFAFRTRSPSLSAIPIAAAALCCYAHLLVQ